MVCYSGDENVIVICYCLKTKSVISNYIMITNTDVSLLTVQECQLATCQQYVTRTVGTSNLSQSAADNGHPETPNYFEWLYLGKYEKCEKYI